MKILKMSSLSFVLLGLVIMASAFSAKLFTTQEFSYNTAFTIGDASTPLSDPLKWDVVSPLQNCSDNTKLCGIVVTTVGAFSMPTEQQIIDDVKARYVANSLSFDHQEVVDIKILINNVDTKVAEATVYLKP